MIRRLLSLLCAFMLLMSLPFAHAEQSSTSDNFASFYRLPDTIYYKCGTVLHGYFKGADTSVPPLEIAYALTSAPYIILDVPTFWETYISGGSGNYTCEALLVYQADLSLDPFTDGWDLEDYFYVEGNSFEYTFTKPGRYFWEFHIMDDEQFFSFQTRIYETYQPADETNDNTVVGKVNSIVSQLITEDMSDYNRALALHDWLIYNANYDYTYTHYEAAGVLLYGTGVCDSYARAYLMLCTAAGLECVYVSGTAYSDGVWGSHGWNLVKLGGSWYHVDCTWDDPGEGGWERHDYFCIDDATMARDHRWNRPDNIVNTDGPLVPDAEGGDFEEDNTTETITPHFEFSTIAEYERGFKLLLAAGIFPERIYARYTGTENIDAFTNNVFWPWLCDQLAPLVYDDILLPNSPLNYGVEQDFLVLELPWTTPDHFIRIAESSLRLSIGETVTVIPAGHSPHADRFTWTSSNPAVATVRGSYDSTNGPTAIITGVAGGECTITVTGPSGVSDSIAVTVLPAHQPDFSLSAATDGNEVILSWVSIPGVTEYQVYRRYEQQDTLIGTTAANRLRVDGSKLPTNVSQQIYVIGKRVVSGETQLQYTSTPIAYGKLSLSYEFTLPAALTRIEAEAFAGCTYLTSVKLPGKVTYIGEDAFNGCAQLTTIRMPASISYISEDAFTGCPLQYAEVSPGSYAEEWLLRHFPDITLVY